MSLHTDRWLWRSAIAFFTIAGLTGVFFRMGVLGSDTFGLSLQNIRHAHSHLMFFGWAGFLPFLIAMQTEVSDLPEKEVSLQKYALWAIIILSPITYFFFLLWGYHPVAIGDAQLPLAAIFSSFVMIAWYVFAYGFWSSKFEKPNAYLPWFSVALLMLLVSSLGAWGVGLLQFFGVQNALLSKAMTHFFLGSFTEGWVVLIVVGMIVQSLKLQSRNFHFSLSTIRIMIAFGAPLTFAYGIPGSLLTTELLWSARAGGIISSIALLVFTLGAFTGLGRKKSIWVLPLLLLGVKGLIQLLISVFPNELWLTDHNLRILYLHILLLGAFTIAGFGWIHVHFQASRMSFNLMAYSCLVVLTTLVLPTNLFPGVMKGIWIFYVAAIAAFLPVIAAIYQLVLLFAKSDQQH